MENFTNRTAEHQRRALDFMLDALGLHHARDKGHHAARSLHRGQEMPAILREHRRLRQRFAELEQELSSVEAELEALDRAPRQCPSFYGLD